MIAIVAQLAAGHEDRPGGHEECRFEQTWFQGDVHFSQELTFERDGTGAWSTGGSDSDAPHKHVSFRWHRDRTSLTAESAGESRTVRYEVKRRDWGCFLGFEAPFLSDNDQSTQWSDSP